MFVNKKSVILMAFAGIAIVLVAVVLAYTTWMEGVNAEKKSRSILDMQTVASADSITGTSYFSAIEINSVDLILPINWNYSEDALYSTICRYSGPNPGKEGNLVITGHDFLSGAHFGNLNKVNIGDRIIVYDESGEKFAYTVSEIETVSPDDVDSLKEFTGDHALTLMTCSENASKRLLVKCTFGFNPAVSVI